VVTQEEGVDVVQPGGVHADQAGRLAVRRAAQVGDVRVERIDQQGDVVIALGERRAAADVVIGLVQVVRGGGLDGAVPGGQRGQADPRPVLAEVLGEVQAVDVAAGGHGADPEPTFVEQVLGRVAGQLRLGQDDAALGAVGVVRGRADRDGRGRV